MRRRPGLELMFCVCLVAVLGRLASPPASPPPPGARLTLTAPPLSLAPAPMVPWELASLRIEGVGIGMTMQQVREILGPCRETALDEHGTGSELRWASRASGDPFDTVMVSYRQGRATLISGDRLSVGGSLRMWAGLPLARLPVPGRPAPMHEHGFPMSDWKSNHLAWQARDALIQVGYDPYSKGVTSIELCAHPEPQPPRKPGEPILLNPH